MARIPEFTRTVLPDRSVGIARAQVARAPYDQKAEAFGQVKEGIAKITNVATDWVLRDAEAKNTTAVNEGVIQYKRDLADRADSMRQERAQNPDNFHKDFDGEMEKLSEDYMKKMPSEAAREALKGSMGNIRTSMYDDNLRWERSAKVENYASSLERSQDNLGVLALRAGQQGKPIDDLLKDADASSVAGSTIVAPDKVEKMKTTMRRGVISNYLEGVAEKNPAKAKEILKSGKYDKEMDADELQRLDKVADAQIDRNKAEARLELADDFDEIATAAKLGLQVPQAKLDEMITKTSAAGMEKETAKLRDFAALQPEMTRFAGQSSAEMIKEQSTLKTQIEGGDTSQVKKYAAFTEILQSKQGMVEKGDALAYYAAHDIVKEPQPMDFSDPNSIKAELDQRRVSAQQIKDLDGIQVPLFTPTEVKGLKQLYDSTDPKQMTALLTSLSASMKPEERAALSRAIAPESSTLAVSLAVGDQNVAEKIMLGAKAKGEVSQALVRDATTVKLKSAITDPIALEHAHDSIYALYKQYSVMAGDAKDAVDSDRLDRSITDIMGPIAQIDMKWGSSGDSQVLSFKDRDTGQWVDEDRLNDILMGITDENLKAINGALPEPPSGGVKVVGPAILGSYVEAKIGTPASMDDNTDRKARQQGYYSAKMIKDVGRYVSRGDGVYAVLVGNLGYLSDKQGNPYLIDARKLEDAQKGKK